MGNRSIGGIDDVGAGLAPALFTSAIIFLFADHFRLGIRFFLHPQGVPLRTHSPIE